MKKIYILILMAAIINLTGCSTFYKLGEVKEIHSENTKEHISGDEAEMLVKDMLLKKGETILPNIEVDYEDDNFYVVHVYEIINDENSSHTATYGWFQVNKITKEISDLQ